MENSRNNAGAEKWAAWWMGGLIVLVGLAAFHHSIWSCFYLDDGWQIEDSPWVEGGSWHAWTFRSLPFFTHWMTWKTWGMSAPAFHAGNLALHLLNAILLRVFLEILSVRALGEIAARPFAFWSALLFAVHPLGSEIPNYVRARDIELVLTFSLVAGWGGAALAGAGRRAPALLAVVPGLIGATFSKEIGFPCALLVAAGGFLVASGENVRGGLSRHRRRAGLIGLLLVGAGILFLATPAGKWAVSLLGDPRLGFHVLTQARIFWHYALLFVYPVHLSSDHLVAWTVSWSDVGAWAALAGLLAGLGLTAVLLRRGKRLAGFLALAALFPVLIYFPLVNSELMVEYRVYPALPFACALFVLLFLQSLSRMRSPRPRLAAHATLAALGVALGWLSWVRTNDWRDPPTLTESILREHPLQARAVNGLAWHYAEHGAPEKVPALHAQVSQILDRVSQWNNGSRHRKLDRGHYFMNRINAESVHALALARGGNPEAGIAHMRWLQERLVSLQMNEPFLWNDYYFTLSRIREAAGDTDGAIADCRTALENAARAFSYGQEPYLYRQEKFLQRLEEKRAGRGTAD